MDSEEKYLDIRNKLNNLEEVKASDDFVNKLHYKIVEIESEKRHEHEKRFDEGRGGFLRNLFSNIQYPWLIPAAGFTILIFFIFYITYLNKDASEKNQQILSTQKRDSNEQTITLQPPQSSVSEKKTDNTIEPQETLTGKNKSINKENKDIAGDLKDQKTPKPQELQDRKSITHNKEESKSISEENYKTPPSVTNETDKDDNVKQNLAMKKAEPEEKNNSGILSPRLNNKPDTSVDTERLMQNKMTENNFQSKKLLERLDKIDDKSLQILRDKISAN